MDYYMKLPRNKKEFALFMAIVSILSVNIIAPIITCFEVDFSLNTWKMALKVIPIIWINVILVVLITYKPAEYMTSKIVDSKDSFNSHIIINILCTVFLMSIFLTIIGSWIGTMNISFEPFINFFYKWPRNFAIAFAVELLIAQPVARFVILKFHEYFDSKENLKLEEEKC